MAWTERYVTTTGAGAHDGTSEANAWTLAEAITSSAAGHRINVQAGTYANTTTSRTFGTGGGAATTAAPKWWRGYKTTIGDMDGQPSSTRAAGTDFPLLTFTSGSVTVSDSFNLFSNFEFRGTAPGTRLVGVTGSKCKFVRCRFDNQEAASGSYAARVSGDGGCYTDCWFRATASATHVVICEERAALDGCVFRGGGVGLRLDMINPAGGGMTVVDCVFDDNGSDGLEVLGHTSVVGYVDGCTIYSPGGHGINVTTAVPLALLVRNCLFHTITTASKYAVNLPSGTNIPHLAGNAYYNVTTRTNNVTEALEFFPVSETSDPLSGAASHDFTLTAGVLSIGGGLPGLFEGP